MDISFKQWCANTKHERTEITVKSDSITFSDDDLCNMGFQFLNEGLRDKSYYEIISALVNYGFISKDQINDWVLEESLASETDREGTQ